MSIPRPWSRRAFLGHSVSCCAHLGLMASAFPTLPRRRWATQERYSVVAREPFGRLERISDGLWALISTPLDGAGETLCNGGIIAGRSGVLMVEGFATDEGARWMAEKARELTGRAPTHVVLSHYHADHTGGLRGYRRGAGHPEVLATSVTRDLTLERNRRAPSDVLEGVTVLDASRPTEIELGGRSVLVVPRRGHTDSDLTLELVDPPVVWCGDLVWNGMFPNYVDALPSRLSREVRLMRRDASALYVPGHGPLADADDFEVFVNLLDDVERAARTAVERGWSVDEAAEAYRLPGPMSGWTLFNPRYFARAIGAWMDELQSGSDETAPRSYGGGEA